MGGREDRSSALQVPFDQRPQPLPPIRIQRVERLVEQPERRARCGGGVSGFVGGEIDTLRGVLGAHPLLLQGGGLFGEDLEIERLSPFLDAKPVIGTEPGSPSGWMFCERSMR